MSGEVEELMDAAWELVAHAEEEATVGWPMSEGMSRLQKAVSAADPRVRDFTPEQTELLRLARQAAPYMRLVA